MKVYRPIKTNWQTQKFGEDKACAKLNEQGKAIRPFKVISTKDGVCPQGYASLYRLLGMKGHSGEDWQAWHGEPIFFPVDAPTQWWAKNEKDKDGGIGVDIISKSPVDLGGRKEYIKFRFWHLKESAVYDGQEVSFGDYIGRCDNTGASSGDHLHWSMKICDANGVPLERNNGYYGATDFSPYFENVFVLNEVKRRQIQVKIKQVQTTLQKITDMLNKIIFNLKQQLEKLRE